MYMRWPQRALFKSSFKVPSNLSWLNSLQILHPGIHHRVPQVALQRGGSQLMTELGRLASIRPFLPDAKFLPGEALASGIPFCITENICTAGGGSFYPTVTCVSPFTDLRRASQSEDYLRFLTFSLFILHRHVCQ